MDRGSLIDDIFELIEHFEDSKNTRMYLISKSEYDNVLLRIKLHFNIDINILERLYQASCKFYSNSSIFRQELREIIDHRQKGKPAMYRGITIKDHVKNPKEEISKIISNDFTFIEYEYYYQILLEPEVDDLAVEALKSLINFK